MGNDRKKKPEWIKDPTVENYVRSFVPQFGNMNHVKAGKLWYELEMAYRRDPKGEGTIKKIGKLENQILELLQ